MANKPHLTVIIRDFAHQAETGRNSGIKPHLDFEYVALRNGEKGIIKPTLVGGKPAFAGGRKRTVNSQASFSSWYVDDPEFNVVKTDVQIPLEEDPNRPGFFRTTYGNPEEINRQNFDDIDASKMYFPIDNQLLGNEGLAHNYHFTTELKPHKFRYRGDEVFTFIGDDDLWVFIDNKLVIDLGGTHVFQKATLDLTLDGKPFFEKEFFGQTLKLIPGQEYSFVLFHAERHTKRSFFYFETTFELIPPPTVRLETPDSEAAEKPLDEGKFRFVLAEEAPLDQDLTVSFLVEGKAKEGQDYKSFSRPVVIPAGQKFVDVPVIPLFDEEIEGDEDVVVTLLDSEDYQRGMPYQGTVTIKDYVPCPNVSVIASIPEALEPGFGQAKVNGEFTITLAEPAFRDLAIAYTISGSATPGTDYKALSGTITIPKGKTAAKISIEPIKDDLKEGDETATITLKETADKVDNCYTINGEGGSNSATVTIVDAPCPIVCVFASDPQAIEPGVNSGGDNGEFTVQLDRPAWKTLTINAAVGGSATPSSDYQPIQVPITIEKGEVEVKIPVIPVEDQQQEGDETVILTLQEGDGYELCPDPSDYKAGVTIIDDVLPPCVGVTAPRPNAAEPGNGQVRVDGLFTIYLNRAAHKDITVHYTVVGTATPNQDYNALPGQVVVPRGQTSVNIPVIPRGDALREPTETVILTLKPSPTQDYELKPSQLPTRAIVNIRDTPPLPCVSIVASKPHAQEPGFKQPGRNGEFTIQLDHPWHHPLNIQYRVGGSARQNKDYKNLNNAVIPAGQTIVRLPVVPLEDQEREGDETVEVTLVNRPEYKLDPNPNRQSAVVKISDTPPIEVEIKAIKDKACEPREAGDEAPRGDQGRFLVELSQPAPQKMKIFYGISGSADPKGGDKDYLLKDDRGRNLGEKPRNNQIIFKAGEKKAVIHVVPLGDRDYRERNETVVAKLEDGKGYIVGRKDKDTVIIKPYKTDPGRRRGGN